MAFTAVAALLHLVLFAWRFADERLYADSGYYLARVINEGRFRIEHGRWVLALPQALPLAGARLGLGLKPLILLHSLSNAAWMAVLLAAAWRLRDRGAMLAIALLQVAGLADGLFCPIFELYYGASLLVLFMAVLRGAALPERWRLPALLLLGALVASCHAIGFILIVAMLALHRPWSNRREAIALGAMFSVVAVSRALTLSAYEKDSAAFILKARDPMALAEACAPARLAELMGYAAHHYPDVLLLAALASIGLAIGRQWGTLAVLGLLIAALQVLIALKLPGWLHDRYREQVDFGVTAWVVLVLAFHGLRDRRIALAGAMLALGIVGYRAGMAHALAPAYVQRTASIRSAIADARAAGLSKAIMPAPRFFGPADHVIELGWSVPVESLLLSAQDGPAGTVSVITAQDAEQPDVAAHLDGFVFRRWDLLDPQWLNPRYFAPPSGTYAALPVPPAGPAPDLP